MSAILSFTNADKVLSLQNNLSVTSDVSVCYDGRYTLIFLPTALPTSAVASLSDFTDHQWSSWRPLTYMIVSKWNEYILAVCIYLVGLHIFWACILDSCLCPLLNDRQTPHSAFL